MNKYLSEFIGTFVLVLFGCGSIAICSQFGIAHSGLIVSLVFGFIVFLCIHFLAKYSGSYINPAVSVVAAIKKLITINDMLAFIVVQFVAALLAALVLKMVFSGSQNIGQTIPNSPDSFLMEFAASMFIMLVATLAPKKTNRANLELFVQCFEHH